MAKKILIMAGGTGGHVYPALALAKKFKQLGHKIEWLGASGIETRVVPQNNIILHMLPTAGFRGKSIFSKIKAIFLFVQALLAAFRILKKVKPDLVIGMGGFASAPGGLMAWFLNIPLMIQEQNSIPGTANKLLAKFATRVFEGFPNSFPEEVNAIYTGNPVREEITEIESTLDKFKQHIDSINILVLGGSLGAKPINLVMPDAISEVLRHEKVNVWHQTGKLSFEETKARYENFNLEVKLEKFIEDIESAYSWADLIICRAGAMTIAELVAAKVPSILIPLPHAIDNHQLYNAMHLVENKCAVLLSQDQLNCATLRDAILNMLDHKTLFKYSSQLQKISQNNAIEKILNYALTEK